MTTPAETIYAQELETVFDCLDAAKIKLNDSQSRHSLAEALTSLDAARKLLATAMERGDDCSNCDGRGFYMGWPHTTCPDCKGTGFAPAEPEQVAV